jgi:DNA repair protein RadC
MYDREERIHRCGVCEQLITPDMAMYETEITPELSIKFKRDPNVTRVKVTMSRDVEALFRKIFDADIIEWKEEMMAIFLDRSNHTVGWMRIGSGNIHGVALDQRSILVTALNTNASGVIIAHNHPSGRATPSDADRTMTRHLRDALALLDIKLHDHLIITKDACLSFANEGML